MIVTFSTSSPMASVALIGADGRVWSAMEEAPRAASGACLRMLDRLLAEAETSVGEVTDWIADVGPGSFIGVRVGVMLAKVLAMTNGGAVRAVASFDLISPNGVVAFPSRRGEWFIRVPGESPIRTPEVPHGAVGFGIEGTADMYPEALRVAAIIDSLPRLRPEELRPDHLMEPSISQPKVPYRRVHA